MDEAYFHFYGETVIDLIGKVPNLVVARTFSKAYGLAALRLGLLAGPEPLLRWVRRVLSPYSVNTIALVALTAALKENSYVEWYVTEVKQARTEFLSRLTELRSAASGRRKPISFSTNIGPVHNAICLSHARAGNPRSRPLCRPGL